MANKKAKKTNLKKPLKSIKDSNKGVFYGLVTLGVVVIIAAFCLVPFGSQSVLAKMLDTMGAHKAAMKVDMFTGGDYNMVTKMATLDLDDPEDCEKLWDLADNDAERTEAVSAKALMKFYPANEAYKDSFNFTYYVDATADARANVISIDQDMEVNVDFAKGLEMAGEDLDQNEFTDSVSALGAINVALSANTILTLDEVYVNLDNLKFASDSSQNEGGLKKWYKYEFGTTDKQREGGSEVISLIQDLTSTKISDVVSEDTGESISQVYCKMMKNVEVGDVEDFTFGYGDNRVADNLRQIDVVQVEDVNKVMAEELPGAIEKVVNDETFSNFLVGKYDWLKDLDAALVKIDDSMALDLPSQGEYEEFIKEEMFAEFDKDEIAEEFGMYSDSDSPFEEEVETLRYYTDPESGDIKAYQMIESVKFNEESLYGQNEELVNMLKDGFVFEITVYDVRTNDEVEAVATPEDSKSMDNLAVDIMNDPAFVGMSGVFYGLYESYYNTYYSPEPVLDDCYYEGISQEEYMDCYYEDYDDSFEYDYLDSEYDYNYDYNSYDYYDK